MYKYKLIRKRKNKAILRSLNLHGKDYIYMFLDKDGNVCYATLIYYKLQKAISISFDPHYDPKYNGTGLDLDHKSTGYGNAYSVINTIFKILNDFWKEHPQIKWLYNHAEEKRYRVYMLMFKKWFPTWVFDNENHKAWCEVEHGRFCFKIQ